MHFCSMFPFGAGRVFPARPWMAVYLRGAEGNSILRTMSLASVLGCGT
jgi:hypothetical protein